MRPVIRAARAHTDEIGCVLEADIYRPDFDFTGVERLKHRSAFKRIWNEHQRCANKPAQGNALGGAFNNGKALKGRHKLFRSFRALIVMDELPRALPWAGLLPGLWPCMPPLAAEGEIGGDASIRWMNVTRYLKARKNTQRRQIIFDGEKLDMEAVWKVRDGFFRPN